MEVVIPASADLSTKFQGMTAASPGQSVTELKKCVTATLRKTVDATKSHHTGHVDIWKIRRARVQTEVRRIVLVCSLRQKLDVNAVRTHPNFVSDRRAEYVCLSKRE